MNFPSEMTGFKQWVLWKRSHEKGKIPFQSNGKPASSTNADTWNTLDEVFMQIDIFDGIGFVFTKDDPFVFIDLDHVIDPATKAFKQECHWAKEIFLAIGSYTEISPSGDGLHIFCKGSLTAHRKKKHSFPDGSALEVYTEGRFSTVTGNLFMDSQLLKECDLKILEKYLFKEVPEVPLLQTQIQERKFNAQFVMDMLVNRDQWNYTSHDQSSADQSLANNIVFYTGDDIDFFEEVWALHPSYALIDRKNNPMDYIARTFRSALKGCRNFYDSNYSSNAQPPQQEENTIRLKRASELTKNIMLPTWLIKPLIPEQGLIEIIGESGSYKSFIVLNMLFCISAGTDFHGLKTTRGTVVYVAGEGATGIQARLKALELHYSIEEYDFYILPMPSNLMDREEVERLSNEIKVIASNEIAITIFDTLHRNSAGSDENSSKDFALILGHIDTYIKPVSKVVGWVHHTGLSNDAKGRGRGTSSRYGAMDTVILIEKLEDNKAVMKCTKQKDFDPFSNTVFSLIKIDINMRDEDGQEIASLVPIQIDVEGTQHIKSKLRKEHHELLDCLRLTISRCGKPMKQRDHVMEVLCVYVSEWKDEAMKLINSNGDNDPKKVYDAKSKTFMRRKTDLINERKIKEYDGMVWITTDIHTHGIFHNTFDAICRQEQTK